MTSGKLAGKNCLVTGGGRGFGREIALTFAREGARFVGVNYVSNEKKARETVEAVRKLGAEAHAFKADVAHAAEVAAMFRDFDAHAPSLDVLVNNAGFNKAAPLLEIAEADLDRVLAVNFKGAFLCTQEAGRRMTKQAMGGHIVNVGSVAGLLARSASAHYGAAKAALHSLTLSSAEALAPNVLVNAVAPGFFDTELNAYVPAERRKRIVEQTPAKRWGTVEELAQTVLFLATCPAFMTGQVLALDGGISNVYFVP
ncbi:MAG: SDR family NAD(P)-dependent oxidoreductase [Thermoplasmatota archaeon]